MQGPVVVMKAPACSDNSQGALVAPMLQCVAQRMRFVVRFQAMIGLAAIAAFTAWPSSGADFSGPAFDEFFTICLKDGPDFLKMSENAYQRSWEQLAEVGFEELAPIPDPGIVRVWVATLTGQDLPSGTIIGFTTAKMGGKSVQTCTLALPDVNPPAFEQRFFERMDAEKIAEERNSVQLSRFYIVFVAGRKQLVKLTIPAPTAAATPLFVASSIMKN